MRYISLLLITALLSCSTQKPVIHNIQNTTYRELLQHNAKWQNTIQTLDGYARITLDTPQYSGNFSADVLLSGSDSLLISVAGPLGINVGKVFVAQKRFVFYNQVMNQFYTGSKKDFEGRNFLQFPLEISQLRDVFIAQDKFNILKKERFEVRDNMYYLEAANGKFLYHIWFDPVYLLIKRIEYFDQDNLLFFKEYDNFKKINDVYFPMSVSFVRPAEKQGLAIFFTKLEINNPVKKGKFNIKVSDSAEQIDLSLKN